jgi:hypothetical protein
VQRAANRGIWVQKEKKKKTLDTIDDSIYLNAFSNIKELDASSVVFPDLHLIFLIDLVWRDNQIILQFNVVVVIIDKSAYSILTCFDVIHGIFVTII